MLTNVVQPLLTDLYQITMAYGYWKSSKHNQHAVFELFFRKNPFHGEFTIFCGLDDVMNFLKNFKIKDEDTKYLKTVLPQAEPEFFAFLQSLDTNQLTIYAQREGSVVFPRVPLICVEGPLALCQLIETTLLTLVNYASLVSTNAVRYRLAAGSDKTLLEFGLRRAQGPNGGLTASKYCYVGGFDGTSNVLAGKEFGIPVRGTQAHSFVNSFCSLEDLADESLCTLKSENGSDQLNVLQSAQSFLAELVPLFNGSPTHEGELASFVAYSCAFPKRFTVLIDTYDSLSSGLTNFLAVALAINKLGYKAVGVRLDSGDLAYQSLVVRQRFCQVAEKYKLDWFKDMVIVASNDIDEETLYSLKDQENAITSFGIGTNLVTCSSQPALGCVYKLVEIDNKPCMKLAQELVKMTFPGKKKVFRLYGKDGTAILDLIMEENEKSPDTSSSVLCRDPFLPTKRANCLPSRVEEILVPIWGGKTAGPSEQYKFDLMEVRKFVQTSLDTLRSDVKRKLNPTPYKVSLSDSLYETMHKQWLDNAPIGTLN